MKKTFLTILQYFIFFGLGGLLIWWQYKQLQPGDKEQIFTAFDQVKERLWLLVPVLIIGFLSHYFRALRWKLLLEPLKLKPTTPNITFAVMIGYLVNLLVPRMGEVARCSILAKYEHEPVDKIIGTIVAERTFDVVCLIAVSLLAFVLQMDVVGDFSQEIMTKFSIKGSSIFIGIMLIVLFFVGLYWVYKKNKHTKIGKFISGMGYGVMSIRWMHKKWHFLGYTFLIWFCYLSLIYIGFKSMDATMGLGWLVALSVLVFGSVGIIATPGGIGAYPIIVQKLLVTVYGVNKNFALAFGWVSWMAQTAIIIVLGLLSLILLPLYNIKPHGQNTVDSKQNHH
jgi:uncharacterized protein (TIRG00374 family)